MQTMLDYALRYAEAGRRVFPCVPGGKTPAISKIEGGRGCLDATNDEGAIRAWWRRHPHANIGLATGEITVLDVDTKGDGMEFITRYPLPATRAVQTPSGGLHFYFLAGEGQYRNRTAVQKHSIDIRGYGGYVLVPPSIVDGRRYEVIGEGTHIAPIPAWLIELLKPPVRPLTSSSPLHRMASIAGILNFCASSPDGQRNSRLFWSACRLFDLSMLPLEVEAQLLPLALRAGLDEREVQKCIGSASNPKYRRMLDSRQVV